MSGELHPLSQNHHLRVEKRIIWRWVPQKLFLSRATFPCGLGSYHPGASLPLLVRGWVSAGASPGTREVQASPNSLQVPQGGLQHVHCLSTLTWHFFHFSWWKQHQKCTLDLSLLTYSACVEFPFKKVGYRSCLSWAVLLYWNPSTSSTWDQGGLYLLGQRILPGLFLRECAIHWCSASLMMEGTELTSQLLVQIIAISVRYNEVMFISWSVMFNLLPRHLDYVKLKLIH